MEIWDVERMAARLPFSCAMGEGYEGWEAVRWDGGTDHWFEGVGWSGEGEHVAVKSKGIMAA